MCRSPHPPSQPKKPQSNSLLKMEKSNPTTTTTTNPQPELDLNLSLGLAQPPPEQPQQFASSSTPTAAPADLSKVQLLKFMMIALKKHPDLISIAKNISDERNRTILLISTAFSPAETQKEVMYLAGFGIFEIKYILWRNNQCKVICIQYADVRAAERALQIPEPVIGNRTVQLRRARAGCSRFMC